MADPRPSLTTRLIRRLGFGQSPQAAPRPQVPAPQVDARPAPSHAAHQDGIGKRIFGRVVNRMDAVRNWRLGYGQGDKLTAGRPDVFRDKLTHQELTCLWRTSGYSRRYVEYLPRLATRKGWQVMGPKGPIDMQGEDDRLDVITRVHDADTWGRLYGGSWLLVMVDEMPPPGVRPDEVMRHPLDPDRVLRVNNLVVLEESEVDPLRYEGNPDDPDYRCTSHYLVAPRIGGLLSESRREHFGMGAAVVHRSRMIYFAGHMLPPAERWNNNGIDDSVLQTVWDQIRNKEILGSSLAMLAAEMRISVIKIRDAADLQVSDVAAYFAERLRMLIEHKSTANAVLLAEGEEYEHKPGTVSGMAELDGTSRQALQSVTGMPEQLWLGSAPGGLSTDGESHRNLTAQEVSAYQVQRYQAALMKFYALVFAAKEGPWCGMAPEGWWLSFNPLDELTEHGVADLHLKVAQQDVLMIGEGVYTAEEVRRGRFGAQGWQMDLVLEATTREETTATEGVPLQQTALNGAQVTAAQGIVVEVLAERLPLESGRSMLREFFNLSTPAVLSILPSPRVAPQGLPGGSVPPAPPTDPEAALLADRRRLADEMTAEGVERCPHGHPNKCRLCGVERRYGLARDESGKPIRDLEGKLNWDRCWRAIDDYDTDSNPATQEPDPEAALDAASHRMDSHAYVRGLLARERAKPAPPGLRVDADDGVSVWIGLPLPEAALGEWRRSRLEAATIAGVTLEELDTRGQEPHITLLWVGKVAPDKAEAAQRRAIEAINTALSAEDGPGPAKHREITLHGCGLGAFEPSPGSKGDTPLYLAIESEALWSLHDQLARALLTEEERHERPWYTPHATVGFLAAELRPEAWWALWCSLSGYGTWEAPEVHLNVGRELVGRWTLRNEA